MNANGVPSDDTAETAGPRVTAAEIGRIAGVTRAAVSNWRRRHDDFPAPVGGTSSSPVFALEEVRHWLDGQRKGQEASPEVRLWQVLRGEHRGAVQAALADVAEYLVARGRSGEPAPDGALPREASSLVDRLAAEASAGEVLDALAARAVDAARRSRSDLVTSPRIARALLHRTGPLRRGAVVLDPAAGLGDVLLAVARTTPGVVRRGQERDPDSARFARLRSELAGDADTVVEAGDSLRDDRWPGLRADLVVCDPPATTSDWGREELLLDPRWELGVPPRAEAELAWLQHAYAHAAPGGRVLMAMPASVAYRRSGRRIRVELVRRGILRQVTALPPGTAIAHPLSVHLWELRRPEPGEAAATTVRLADLVGNDPDGPLDPRPEQVADVPLVDLLDDTCDLTPAAHVRPARETYEADYRRLAYQVAEQLEALRPLLPTLERAGEDEGVSVSVAELARAGLVRFDDDTPVPAAEDRLDPDYLHGYLQSPANRRRSTSGSGTHRTEARSARLPQRDIAEQRRFGAAFRALAEFEERLARLTELGGEAASLARDGLTGGALAPGDGEPERG